MAIAKIEKSSKNFVKGELYRMKLLASMLLFFTVGLQSSAFAQEGFPLDGTWRGEWGVPGGEMTLAVVIMEWDGVKINGLINPGRNSFNFDYADLNPEDWSVRIEATTVEGEIIIIAGMLENIGSYARTITGVWSQGGVENQIILTRE